VQFDFGIAVGVRFSDQDGKNELQGLIDQTRGDIDRLLAEYHFPLVQASAPAEATEPPH
jgi:hypothetical protein